MLTSGSDRRYVQEGPFCNSSDRAGMNRRVFKLVASMRQWLERCGGGGNMIPTEAKGLEMCFPVNKSWQIGDLNI